MILTVMQTIPANEGMAIRKQGDNYGSELYRWSSRKEIGRLGLIGSADVNLYPGDFVEATNDKETGMLSIRKVSKKDAFRISQDEYEIFSGESAIPLRTVKDAVSDSRRIISSPANPHQDLRQELEARLTTAQTKMNKLSKELEQATKEVMQLNAAIGGLSIVE
jgi:hypothetical protein